MKVQLTLPADLYGLIKEAAHGLGTKPASMIRDVLQEQAQGFEMLVRVSSSVKAGKKHEAKSVIGALIREMQKVLTGAKADLSRERRQARGKKR